MSKESLNPAEIVDLIFRLQVYQEDRFERHPGKCGLPLLVEVARRNDLPEANMSQEDLGRKLGYDGSLSHEILKYTVNQMGLPGNWQQSTEFKKDFLTLIRTIRLNVIGLSLLIISNGEIQREKLRTMKSVANPLSSGSIIPSFNWNGF